MFDFDAGKLIIIGVVALIVIGPKELPRVLRQLGQAYSKMRRMAADFQGQFMEAMREAELDDIGPDVVYTHFPEDVNDDHRLVAKCCWVACRPYRRRLSKFAVFETPSSTEWGWPMPAAPLQPNLYVDITGSIDVKVAAMECYETELRDYPHPRSARALRERAAYWGSHVGLLAAEPFRVLRELG